MSEKIRPFVKWAGGKGSLIPQLNNFYPYELKNGIIERYIEPFVGGGICIWYKHRFNKFIQCYKKQCRRINNQLKTNGNRIFTIRTRRKEKLLL